MHPLRPTTLAIGEKGVASGYGQPEDEFRLEHRGIVRRRGLKAEKDRANDPEGRTFRRSARRAGPRGAR